uniref:uncharacterized protein LOC105350851 n=1 Tax=Fragaria vesca subsp. vesca TaxID=101020 RepID=UPI0005C8A083|nr:PREDICTED: uncharacterized protein LOC105350851 [Fragaria vesca subsp. vesca]
MLEAEKRGFYSVKTAYWIARTKVMGEVLTNSSTGDPFKELWKHVWEAKVPGKVRICIWRACTNTLPSRAALCMKGHTGDTRCLLCPCPFEDTSHILVRCPFAQAVLAAPPFQINTAVEPYMTFKEWLLDKDAKMQREKFLSFGCFMVIVGQ